VVLAADNNYLPAALFVAQQLADGASGNYDILILHADPVSPLHRDKFPHVRFIPAEIGPELSNSLKSDRRTAAVYTRLLIPQLVPAAYKKLLYLDCDVWIGERPITALLDLDLEGYALGAVRDTREVLGRPREHFTEYKPKLCLAADTPYFNSGVILIDRARFALERIGERVTDYVASGRYLGGLVDQSALNAVVAGRWRELSPIWNWQFAARVHLTREFAPGIIHFIGPNKPWADARARYPRFYASQMLAFYEANGFSNFAKRVSGRIRARRMLADTLTQIAHAPYDRRERAIRKYIRETDFWDARKPASRQKTAGALVA
jgi:lipopolysaccharide biosynthesis glycosyltransferase